MNTVFIAPNGERYIFRFAGDRLPDIAEGITESMVAGAQGVLLDVRRPKAALGVASIAVTLGERGVLTEKDWIPVFKVPIQDTTGAGDVFHGAFAPATAQGRGEEESVRYDSAAAA